MEKRNLPDGSISSEMFDQVFPVAKVQRDGKVIPTVNARDLHRVLKVGRDFSNWIKDRIEEYGFVEGQDFIKFDSPKLANQNGMKSGRGGDRRSIDYHVSFDMAKELGMVEKSPIGRAIRLYFIRKEAEARNRFADDRIQAKLALYLTEEIRPWQKTFPDELWLEFSRLTGREIDGSQRPRFWGKLVNELVYGYLDEDVKDWLKQHASPSTPNNRYHQRFNEQYGVVKLKEHIWLVIGTARNSFSMTDLRTRMRLQFGKTAQLSFLVPPQITSGKFAHN